MVNIKKIDCPKEKYSVKCPYEMTPSRVVIHNTANDAPAINEINYMLSRPDKVSFHFAVDDKEIVQGIDLNRNAWHASDGGNGKGNREGIAIEICYSLSGGDRFIKAQENAAELTAELLKKYGWGFDKVTKHQDYANKYCPHRTLDMGWDNFINLVKKYMGVKEIVTMNVGDKVKVNKGAKSYEGTSIASFVYNNVYTIDYLTGNRAVLDKGGLNTAFNVKDLTLVEATKPASNTYEKRIAELEAENKALKAKITNAIAVLS